LQYQINNKNLGMKKILVCSLLCFSTLSAMAQEVELTPLEKTQAETERIGSLVDNLNKLKISGYIQSDLQFGQKDASLKVGTAKASTEDNYTRIGIRRGRLKFAYSDLFEGAPSTAVAQFEMTEKAVEVKELYFSVTDPWTKWISLQAGIANRPFGNEIPYSSSSLETPERSTACNNLFPNEVDLGGMLTFQAPKGNPWDVFKLETGLFAGNGMKQDTHNRKDWISHLTYKKSYNDVQFGLGASLYLGGTYQGTANVYEMSGNQFVKVADAKVGGYSDRTYYGLDGQLLLSTGAGMTTLRAEMVAGKQPGALGDSKSPNASALPTTDTYRRNFMSYNIYLIQDLGQSKHSLVARYDAYDPNTKLSGDEVGLGGTGKGDIARHNIGLGYLYRMNNNFRLMAYYDMAFNEKSKNLSGYGSDLKDNIFTVRLQYKF
jgi:hypothetical protein